MSLFDKKFNLIMESNSDAFKAARLAGEYSTKYGFDDDPEQHRVVVSAFQVGWSFAEKKGKVGKNEMLQTTEKFLQHYGYDRNSQTGMNAYNAFMIGWKQGLK
jgi:hypothetical protein